MKIEVALELKKGQNAAEAVLASRGLSKDWLTADEKDMLDGREMRNFDKAAALLKDNLDKKIGLYVDSDTDGFSSSGIMYAWLKEKYNAEPIVIMPEGKIHGIILDLIPEDLDLLIVPDASSSEGEIHKQLINKGTQVLVLDHHEINLENGEYAVIVNPHHPECTYKNKTISGTGVVYKFVEGIDKNEGVDFHTKHLDLAAIATVADSMNLKDMDNKAMINLGFKEIKNPYFKEYYKFNQRLADKNFDAMLVSFYLAPPINALIRLGTREEKTELFLAIAGAIKPQPVIAMIGRVKSKQDRDKTPIITRIGLNLQRQEDSLSHAAIMTEVPPHAAKSLTGVIAGQLTNLYRRPIFLYRKDGNDLVGSSRNVNNSPVANLKDFCLESGLFNWAAGHQSAFGFSIPEENMEKFLTYCDDNLPPYEPVFYVDLELETDKARIVEELSTLTPHFGPGFPPVLVTERLYVRPSDLAIIGKKGSTLKFQSDEVTYISFNFKDDLPMAPSVWTIVGEPSMNEFNGNSKPQVQLKGWLVEDIDL